MRKPTVYIATGQKQVLHTLWQENIRDEFFVKNLPVDKEKAIAEAKKYAEEIGYEYDGVYGSPKFKKATHVERYGIVFKHKRKKGKSYYIGYPTPEFWDEWKKDKEKLKRDGFSVSKYPERRTMAMRDDEPLRLIWYVFYRPQEDQE